MDNRITVSHLWRSTKRGFGVALLAMVVAIVAIPETSLAASGRSPSVVHVDRPLDGQGDSPIVP